MKKIQIKLLSLDPRRILALLKNKGTRAAGLMTGGKIVLHYPSGMIANIPLGDECPGIQCQDLAQEVPTVAALGYFTKINGSLSFPLYERGSKDLTPDGQVVLGNDFIREDMPSITETLSGSQEARKHPYLDEVTSIVSECIMRGMTPRAVDDGGEELITADDPQELVEAILAVDESRLYVKHPDQADTSMAIFIVLGNEPGIAICDYADHPALDQVADAVNKKHA